MIFHCFKKTIHPATALALGVATWSPSPHRSPGSAPPNFESPRPTAGAMADLTTGEDVDVLRGS